MSIEQSTNSRSLYDSLGSSMYRREIEFARGELGAPCHGWSGRVERMPGLHCQANSHWKPARKDTEVRKDKDNDRGRSPRPYPRHSGLNQAQARLFPSPLKHYPRDGPKG
jgi:hypothetical protein